MMVPSDSYYTLNPYLYSMPYDPYSNPWVLNHYYELIPLDEKQTNINIKQVQKQIRQKSKSERGWEEERKSQGVGKIKRQENIHQQFCQFSSIKTTESKNIIHNEIQLLKNKNDYQKDGRNANSNLLRMFFRRIRQRIQTQPEIVQKIIHKNKCKIKIGSFIQWFDIYEIDHKNYIRLPDVKEIFIGSKNSKQQAKIMRILLQDFLNKEATSCILTSKKMKKNTINHNLQSIRNILGDVYKSGKK